MRKHTDREPLEPKPTSGFVVVDQTTKSKIALQEEAETKASSHVKDSVLPSEEASEESWRVLRTVQDKAPVVLLGKVGVSDGSLQTSQRSAGSRYNNVTRQTCHHSLLRQLLRQIRVEQAKASRLKTPHLICWPARTTEAPTRFSSKTSFCRIR